DGTQPVAPGCDLQIAGTIPANIFVLPPVAPDGSGVATFPLPVPNDASLEGTHLNFHAAEVQAGTGAVLGLFDLSDGLRVRLGSAGSNCP
ncbi:MAG TPA: hypothetical protein VKF62_08270, partial [Planctomycetota bacterium]|nr:hypothetical protein [Planctomycetota bacterium]